jgi:hypothetical protein
MSSPKSSVKRASAKQVNKNSASRSSSTKNRPVVASHNKIGPRDDGPTVREIDFAELSDGSIVEIIEDPTDPTRTRFAIFKRGRVRFANRIEDRGQVLVPVPRTVVGLADVTLPTGVANYRSTTRLIYTILKFIGYAVDVPNEIAIVLAAFVLYTYVADRLPMAVYLSIVGLPQSGKSTLLELLSLLCRRPLLVSDISQAAVYRACGGFGVTLLVDEVEWQSSNTRALRQLWRAGTGRSARALRIRDSSFSFGPKVFGSLEPSWDSALNDRCIRIPMTETTKRQLIKPGDPRMLKSAAEIRKQLLKFRFNFYKKIRPAMIPGAEELRPRSRDLLSSLAAPLTGVRLWNRTLLEIIKSRHDPLARESLGPRQAALVAVLFTFVHEFPSISTVSVKFLADTTNAMLKVRGERVMLTYKAVGSLLWALGFREHQRTNSGWILRLDSATLQRIHQLVRTHDNEFIQTAAVEGCSICRPASTNSDSPDAGD